MKTAERGGIGFERTSAFKQVDGGGAIGDSKEIDGVEADRGVWICESGAKDLHLFVFGERGEKFESGGRMGGIVAAFKDL